ncbi:MAG TPA: heme-binding protein [Kaistiaceae bacterium]|nr:heme-binding protein [Kaistiaceae bacterium]
MRIVETSAALTLEAAEAIVSAAVRAGLKRGVKLNAAVVDQGGNLLAFLRAPGAFLESIAIAQDKARSAAGFGLSTDELAGALKGDDDVYNGIALRAGVAAFGGGYPIRVEGILVGGVGVSGGSLDDDRGAAKAGLAAIGIGI